VMEIRSKAHKALASKNAPQSTSLLSGGRFSRGLGGYKVSNLTKRRIPSTQLSGVYAETQTKQIIIDSVGSDMSWR
jgi:hypothetical protein